MVQSGGIMPPLRECSRLSPHTKAGGARPRTRHGSSTRAASGHSSKRWKGDARVEGVERAASTHAESVENFILRCFMSSKEDAAVSSHLDRALAKTGEGKKVQRSEARRWMCDDRDRAQEGRFDWKVGMRQHEASSSKHARVLRC